MTGESADPGDERLRCGCCGRQKPASRLSELGCTPGVFICAGCALQASFRASGIALDRLSPRTVLQRVRHRGEKVRDKPILAIPILPSTDLARTARYYAQLGFEVVEQLDTYLVLTADHVELHFIEDDPQLRPGLAFVNVPEVDLLRERLEAQGATGVGPVRNQFGLREFLATDPDGNRIRVGHATGD